MGNYYSRNQIEIDNNLFKKKIDLSQYERLNDTPQKYVKYHHVKENYLLKLLSRESDNTENGEFHPVSYSEVIVLTDHKNNNTPYVNYYFEGYANRFKYNDLFDKIKGLEYRYSLGDITLYDGDFKHNKKEGYGVLQMSMNNYIDYELMTSTEN